MLTDCCMLASENLRLMHVQGCQAHELETRECTCMAGSLAVGKEIIYCSLVMPSLSPWELLSGPLLLYLEQTALQEEGLWGYGGYKYECSHCKQDEPSTKWC